MEAACGTDIGALSLGTGGSGGLAVVVPKKFDIAISGEF
jgi:hypothetical protein